MSDTLMKKMSWQTDSGQIMDADRRYVMLRTDVLMGLFALLPEQQRQAALQAFQESVRHNGGQSAKAYFDSVGHDRARLLETMAPYSAELGWGCWSFSDNGVGRLQLRVLNSPFAQGYGNSRYPVCHPIAGMLEAVGSLIYKTAVKVEETECAAQGCGHCIFQIHAIDASNETNQS